MKIQDLMKFHSTTCQAGDCLDQVTRSMWTEDLGWLPVVDDKQRLIGVLTDRDACMHATTSGKPLAELIVKGCMQVEVSTCRASDPIETALSRFADRQVHRLPVVDDQGVLIGVITLGDFARAWRTESSAAKKKDLGQKAWQCFSAIRRPHTEPAHASEVVIPVSRKPAKESKASDQAAAKETPSPKASTQKTPTKKTMTKKAAAKKKSTKGRG